MCSSRHSLPIWDYTLAEPDVFHRGIDIPSSALPAFRHFYCADYSITLSSLLHAHAVVPDVSCTPCSGTGSYSDCASPSTLHPASVISSGQYSFSHVRTGLLRTELALAATPRFPPVLSRDRFHLSMPSSSGPSPCFLPALLIREGGETLSFPRGEPVSHAPILSGPFPPATPSLDS